MLQRPSHRLGWITKSVAARPIFPARFSTVLTPVVTAPAPVRQALPTFRDAPCALDDDAEPIDELGKQSSSTVADDLDDGDAEPACSPPLFVPAVQHDDSDSDDWIEGGAAGLARAALRNPFCLGAGRDIDDIQEPASLPRYSSSPSSSDHSAAPAPSLEALDDDDDSATIEPASPGRGCAFRWSPPPTRAADVEPLSSGDDDDDDDNVASFDDELSGGEAIGQDDNNNDDDELSGGEAIGRDDNNDDEIHDAPPVAPRSQDDIRDDVGTKRQRVRDWPEAGKRDDAAPVRSSLFACDEIEPYLSDSPSPAGRQAGASVQQLPSRKRRFISTDAAATTTTATPHLVSPRSSRRITNRLELLVRRMAGYLPDLFASTPIGRPMPGACSVLVVQLAALADHTQVALCLDVKLVPVLVFFAPGCRVAAGHTYSLTVWHQLELNLSMRYCLCSLCEPVALREPIRLHDDRLLLVNSSVELDLLSKSLSRSPATPTTANVSLPRASTSARRSFTASLQRCCRSANGRLLSLLLLLQCDDNGEQLASLHIDSAAHAHWLPLCDAVGATCRFDGVFVKAAVRLRGRDPFCDVLAAFALPPTRTHTVYAVHALSTFSLVDGAPSALVPPPCRRRRCPQAARVRLAGYVLDVCAPRVGSDCLRDYERVPPGRAVFWLHTAGGVVERVTVARPAAARALWSAACSSAAVAVLDVLVGSNEAEEEELTYDDYSQAYIVHGSDDNDSLPLLAATADVRVDFAAPTRCYRGLTVVSSSPLGPPPAADALCSHCRAAMTAVPASDDQAVWYCPVCKYATPPAPALPDLLVRATARDGSSLDVLVQASQLDDLPVAGARFSFRGRPMLNSSSSVIRLLTFIDH